MPDEDLDLLDEQDEEERNKPSSIAPVPQPLPANMAASIAPQPTSLAGDVRPDLATLARAPMGQNQPLMRTAPQQQQPVSITGMKSLAPTPAPKSITALPLGPAPAATSDLLAPRPAYDKLQQMEASGPGINRFSDRHHILGPLVKGLETAGTILAPGAMMAVPSTRMNFALRTAQQKNAADEEAKEIADTQAERENNQRIGLTEEEANLAAARAQEAGQPKQQTANLQRAVIDDPKNPGTPLNVDFNPKTGQYLDPQTQDIIPGAKPWEKKTEPTSPFEAFAYGTPQERQAAQDFLTFEKKVGAESRSPSEVEERYALYKRDPEAYKAMFGDRGDAQDQANTARSQAQATRMLKYLDGRRKEVQNDFMLDDTEKQQKLSEIDQLEKPYQDAAQGKSGGQGEGDTIQVISPKGVAGTVPVGNLKKALKKGYKVAPNQ
ncbi:MAG: hypothetical protein WBD87_08845 [Candidatus Acidiferrales bacterium]